MDWRLNEGIIICSPALAQKNAKREHLRTLFQACVCGLGGEKRERIANARWFRFAYFLLWLVYDDHALITAASQIVYSEFDGWWCKNVKKLQRILKWTTSHQWRQCRQDTLCGQNSVRKCTIHCANGSSNIHYSKVQYKLFNLLLIYFNKLCKTITVNIYYKIVVFYNLKT